MLRMEIALFLIVAFVAGIYFSARRERTPLHRTFSVLLVTMLAHLALDGVTLYTVNHLDTVPVLLNDTLHRAFIATMLLAMYLFYQYIAILVEEETGRPRRLDLAARCFLGLAVLAALALPVRYAITPEGNYSTGPQANVCYGGVAFYLLLCAGLLVFNWRQLHRKKRFAIGAALVIEFTVCILQGLHHTWLISGWPIWRWTASRCTR